MATKSQEILLKGNTTNASAVPSSLKVREIAINALDRSLFTNDGNSIVKLYTGTTKWFDVNGNANNALKLGGILASEYINKETFNSHINNSTIHITSAERTAWNNKWEYNEETIKGVKVNAAVNADYASSAGNADTLDGVHYQNILERQSSGASLSGTATGWFRIAESLTTDVMAITFLLAIRRDYWTTPNESYLFSISISYGGGISITQLSGYANTRLITKIRVDWATTKIAYVDLYINTSTNQNSYYWYTIGGAKSYTAWTANPTLVGTAYEFTTVNGCKSDRGFTGDLVGNSSSATKLQDNTAFTVWGQKFFENGKPKNVSGDLIDVGNITASGKATIQGDIVCGGEVVAVAGEGTPAGVTDYSALTGKPAINGVTLVSGNNTLAALGIQAAGDYATNSGVTTLLANYADKTFVSNNYVGKSAFNSHTADTDIHITAEERVAWNAKWNYNEDTIKAVKVNSALSADSVAWTGISGKPTTFTPSAHTHTASEISGLPTNLSAFTNDVGYITGITKSMVEGVLTGDITSHTHTFASLTSKPTTIAGYGITDAYTSSTIDSKLSGYLPLSGGKLSSNIETSILTLNSNVANAGTYLRLEYLGSKAAEFGHGWGLGTYMWCNGHSLRITSDGTAYADSNILIHSGNYNSYAPTLTGTGASGTWGINISGNAASATKLQTPRNIWGQSFDGTSDVSGDIILGVGSDYTIGTGWDSSERIAYNKIVFGAGSTGLQYISGTWTYGNVVAHNFKVSPNDTTALAITNNSNVLIGTTTDNGYKLDVNGKTHITGDLIVDGEVSALVA